MTPDDLGLIAYNAATGTSHAEWPFQVREEGRAMWRRVGVAVDKASRRDAQNVILATSRAWERLYREAVSR